MSACSLSITIHALVRRPSDGLSQHEFAVYDEYFRNNGSIYGIMVNIKAADGGNLMRKDYLVRFVHSNGVEKRI